MRQRAVVHAAMILNPSRMVRVLVEVLRADMVMLASDHPAKAGEVAFRLIGGDAHLRIGFRVINAESFEAGVQRVPMSGFVGIEDGGLRRDPASDPDAFAFRLHHKGQGPAATLAQGNHNAALAGLVFGLAAVNPVLDMVPLADRAADIAAINLDVIVQLLSNDVRSHGFAELVAQNESRLVLTIQVARHLQGGDALRAVHEQADRRQEVNERHLARSEDRSRGDGELMQAFPAFEFAARGDLVGVQSAATRANRSAVRLGPAHFAKGLVSPFLASLVDGLEGEGASLCGEEEVLGHSMSPYSMMFCIVYTGLHRLIQWRISSNTMIYTGGVAVATRKDQPANVEYETRAKNLLKAELKRKGVTYAQLAEKLSAMGIQENERNLNNKISRGGFTAAFLLECLEAIGVNEVRLR